MDLQLVTTGIPNALNALFAYQLYRAQRKLKSFSYSVSEIPIISVRRKLDGVAVTYRGKPVESLRVFMTTVWNSGDVEIDEEEFNEPISFCEEQTARGNSLAVSEIVEVPEGARAELFSYEVRHHEIRTALKNMLFNPGDIVIVKTIIADYGGEPLDVDVRGRIARVKKFKKEDVYADSIPPIIRPLVRPLIKHGVLVRLPKGQSDHVRAFR